MLCAEIQSQRDVFYRCVRGIQKRIPVKEAGNIAEALSICYEIKLSTPEKNQLLLAIFSQLKNQDSMLKYIDKCLVTEYADFDQWGQFNFTMISDRIAFKSIIDDSVLSKKVYNKFVDYYRKQKYW